MKEKKVITFGSFDVVHPGHLYYLKQAKKKADFLIVIVARDSNIEKIKGQLPKHDENKRLEKIKSIPIVDEALLGNEEDPYKVIIDKKPDIIALGYDQNSFSAGLKDFLKEKDLKAKIIRIDSYKEHIYKSSKLK